MHRNTNHAKELLWYSNSYEMIINFLQMTSNGNHAVSDITALEDNTILPTKNDVSKGTADKHFTIIWTIVLEQYDYVIVG